MFLYTFDEKTPCSQAINGMLWCIYGSYLLTRCFPKTKPTGPHTAGSLFLSGTWACKASLGYWMVLSLFNGSSMKLNQVEHARTGRTGKKIHLQIRFTKKKVLYYRTLNIATQKQYRSLVAWLGSSTFLFIIVHLQWRISLLRKFRNRSRTLRTKFLCTGLH